MSKTIKIGNTQIGGITPVAVQTMWKDRLTKSDLKDDTLINRINTLGSIGCAILRFAVPDIESAEILGQLARAVSMPLAADIHFDYRIALRCMDFPVAKIRINPGNIGGKDKTAAVLEKAGAKGIPIRIGVNAGSLPISLRKRVEEGLPTAEALVQAAENEISIFKEFHFDDYLVSMKACGIADTIEANKILSQRTDASLHLGVTEAGPLAAGVVANTAALVTLLSQGIGDTIRVSLSDTVENEVIAGREIIRAASELCKTGHSDGFARLEAKGVRIISCPRCGRHGFDTHGFTSRWMPKLYAMGKSITVAIMGCEVNGPGEAKHADIGITGAGDKVLIFKHGQVVRTIEANDADKIFEEELDRL